MTAKEQVLAEAPGWTEEQAKAALRAVEGRLGSTVADDGEQPPFSLIGAFRAGRDDLSALASRDEFEPKPFR